VLEFGKHPHDPRPPASSATRSRNRSRSALARRADSIQEALFCQTPAEIDAAGACGAARRQMGEQRDRRACSSVPVCRDDVTVGRSTPAPRREPLTPP
jgi:hypothetical protein